MFDFQDVTFSHSAWLITGSASSDFNFDEEVASHRLTLKVESHEGAVKVRVMKAIEFVDRHATPSVDCCH